MLREKEQIISLITEANEEIGHIFSSDDQIAAYADKIMQRCIIVKISDQDEIAAFIAFYANDPEGERGYYAMLCVAKAHRRYGYGRLLMENVINILKKRKFKWVDLEVEVENTAAVQMHQKIGFIKIEDRGKTWIMRYNLQ